MARQGTQATLTFLALMSTAALVRLLGCARTFAVAFRACGMFGPLLLIAAFLFRAPLGRMLVREEQQGATAADASAQETLQLLADIARHQEFLPHEAAAGLTRWSGRLPDRGTASALALLWEGLWRNDLCDEPPTLRSPTKLRKVERNRAHPPASPVARLRREALSASRTAQRQAVRQLARLGPVTAVALPELGRLLERSDPGAPLVQDVLETVAAVAAWPSQEEAAWEVIDTRALVSALERIVPRLAGSHRETASRARDSLLKLPRFFPALDPARLTAPDPVVRARSSLRIACSHVAIAVACARGGCEAPWLLPEALRALAEGLAAGPAAALTVCELEWPDSARLAAVVAKLRGLAGSQRPLAASRARTMLKRLEPELENLLAALLKARATGTGTRPGALEVELERARSAKPDPTLDEWRGPEFPDNLPAEILPGVRQRDGLPEGAKYRLVIPASRHAEPVRPVVELAAGPGDRLVITNDCWPAVFPVRLRGERPSTASRATQAVCLGRPGDLRPGEGTRETDDRSARIGPRWPAGTSPIWADRELPAHRSAARRSRPTAPDQDQERHAVPRDTPGTSLAWNVAWDLDPGMTPARTGSTEESRMSDLHISKGLAACAFVALLLIAGPQACLAQATFNRDGGPESESIRNSVEAIFDKASSDLDEALRERDDASERIDELLRRFESGSPSEEEAELMDQEILKLAHEKGERATRLSERVKACVNAGELRLALMRP